MSTSSHLIWDWTCDDWSSQASFRLELWLLLPYALIDANPINARGTSLIGSNSDTCIENYLYSPKLGELTKHAGTVRVRSGWCGPAMLGTLNMCDQSTCFVYWTWIATGDGITDLRLWQIFRYDDRHFPQLVRCLLYIYCSCRPFQNLVNWIFFTLTFPVFTILDFQIISIWPHGLVLQLLCSNENRINR